MDSALRASLRLSKIAHGDFVAALHSGYRFVQHLCKIQ